METRDGSPSIERLSCPQLQAARRLVMVGSVAVDMGKVEARRQSDAPGATYMATISGGRANDERVKCLRILMATAKLTWKTSTLICSQESFSRTILRCVLRDKLPASWYNVCYVPTGVGETGWHNPPQRLLVLWLTGEVEFETSDGGHPPTSAR